MKRLLILIPFLLHSANLKTILNHTSESNLIQAKAMLIEAKRAEINSIKSSKLPTIDFGVFANSSNPRQLMQPGVVYGASVKLKYAIYDGGLKRAKIEQKRFELAGAMFDKSFFAKSLNLQIVKDYYNIKSLDALIKALIFKKKALKEQIKKVKVLLNSGFVTKDNLYSLNAALLLTQDNINSLKFKRESLIKLLQIKANYQFKTLGNSYFKKRALKFRPNDLIRAMQLKKRAILSSSKAIKSAIKPHINLEASYSLYGYDRADTMHPKGLDKQAKINLNAGVRLYDGGVSKEQIEAVKLQALSLGLEIKQKLLEQRVNFKLSKERLKVAKEHIKAIKAEYIARRSLFKSVKKEFESGLADYVSYLDALSQEVSAKANLAKAKYELEIAYAIYYYNGGYDIRKFLAGD